MGPASLKVSCIIPFYLIDCIKTTDKHRAFEERQHEAARQWLTFERGHLLWDDLRSACVVLIGWSNTSVSLCQINIRYLCKRVQHEVKDIFSYHMNWTFAIERSDSCQWQLIWDCKDVRKQSVGHVPLCLHFMDKKTELGQLLIAGPLLWFSSYTLL